MKKLLLIPAILATLLSAEGITPFVGLAMNGTSSFKSESPLGIFGVRYETEYLEPYYRHISSIPQVDETQGINEIGLNAKYRYKFLEPYIGMTYTDSKMTSRYYTKQLGHKAYVSGLRVLYKIGEPYIEYRKSDKQDFVMYGFNFKFKPEDLLWKE